MLVMAGTGLLLTASNPRHGSEVGPIVDVGSLLDFSNGFNVEPDVIA
jgi:hypothetical protein